MPQYQQITIHPDMTLRELAVASSENFSRITASPPNKTDSGWSTANETEGRTLDVSTATLGDLSNIVATLINVLTEQGVLKT